VRAGRALIGDDMGLGKTIQAIAAMTILDRHFGGAKVLVICPTSLKYQWQSEILRFSGTQGEYAARVIRRRVAGREKPAPFWYWDKGDLAIVGRTYAVADLRIAKFSGVSAWLLWATVHLYFLIGFANRLFVLLQWGFDFLAKRRQVRMLPEETAPARKFIDPAA